MDSNNNPTLSEEIVLSRENMVNNQRATTMEVLGEDSEEFKFWDSELYPKMMNLARGLRANGTAW